MESCTLASIALVLTTFNSIVAIRITRYVVPATVRLGALAELDCAYDLEGESLYDVKWYKDGQEFFRCTPDGRVHAFHVEGIELYDGQEALLGSCPVVLIAMDVGMTGQYRCEASTEAPEFRTAARTVSLKVIVHDRDVVRPAKRIQQSDNEEYSKGTKVRDRPTESVNGQEDYYEEDSDEKQTETSNDTRHGSSSLMIFGTKELIVICLIPAIFLQ